MTRFVAIVMVGVLAASASAQPKKRPAPKKEAPTAPLDPYADPAPADPYADPTTPAKAPTAKDPKGRVPAPNVAPPPREMEIESGRTRTTVEPSTAAVTNGAT